MQKKQRIWCMGFFVFGMLSSTAFAVQMVIPSGMPTGVRMTANGVVVCGMTEVQSAGGEVCPAKKAGLRTGDILYTVNGETIASGDEFAEAVQENGGKEVVLEGERDDVAIRVTVQPVQSTADSRYHLGLLVRDSMAGIGTITYIDPSDGTFGALGHAVCECDSGTQLPLENGSLMPAAVIGVQKGKRGEPGELLGSFQLQTNSGSITKNTTYGIFGKLNAGAMDGQAIPVAEKEEIKVGEAEILTCVSGTTPKKYTISIEHITGQDKEGKSMSIRVTDSELLEATGGIVQGMSGSPIIQNGKLVGAVTHVLVNDPTRGYGISAEKMLEAAA
jgi:stage IV sporulation protein B